MAQKFEKDGAKLTLYTDAPSWDGHGRTFAVGGVSFPDAASGLAVLKEAMAQAKAQGASSLIGPMDGDTWHSYRLVTDSTDRPAFLMEPTSKPHDQQAFADAGFTPISHYFSASVPLGGIDTQKTPQTDGITLEHWDGTDPEALFAQVHDLSCTAFAGNPFYKPIDLPDFLAMYMPVVPLLKQDLIWFARDDAGKLVGFLFGIPNYAEGPETKTAILKTYASLAKGAGYALSQQFYASAKDMGCDTAIHALMHDDNLSASRSDTNGAEVFRRYALMGGDLE